MYVNTNVAAMNAWLNLENTQNQMTNTLQQLSSGYRINTAANDPAGLAISQQMQSQIQGLNQAYSNAQSGVSLLQTADGGLGKIQNILQSMRSLASEAATATMNATDTSNLQTEMNQYAKEITQITNTTQFNNINLLGGAFQNQNIQVGANQGQALTLSLGAADAYTLGVVGSQVTGQGTGGETVTNGGAVTANGLSAGSYTLSASTSAWSATVGTNNNSDLTGISGSYTGSTATTYDFKVTSASSGAATAVQYSTDGGNTWSSAQSLTGGALTLNGVTFTFGGTAAAVNDQVDVTLNPQSTAYSLTGGLSATVDGQVVGGQSVTMTNAGNTASLSFDASNTVPSLSQSLTVTGTTVAVGTAETAWTPTSANLTVSEAGTAATGTGGVLSTQATATSGLNIGTQGNAAVALNILSTAINTLSTERANVGAYQNRLNFAAANDQTTSQNLQAARGGIMNADMALEMAQLSKEQVLQQSGVAMLAQANQVPQALLKLLP